ncbi:hypothetical protein ACIGXI_26510 [Kitasatospora aureofaciens]|uniref:hypothetical protein n=1 Tax=Kitasatospora aureofaciens TaxID=1894 RepID=UPI0037C74C10
MGSSFYVSADQEHVGPWTFTGEQVKESVRRHWPDAIVSSAFDDFLEIEAEIAPGRRAELSFNHRRRAFSFQDREPLSAPLTVIYEVLRDLAPEMAVVRWIDYDAELTRMNLNDGLQGFTRGLA